MRTIHLAQMLWCEHQEPICAGTNRRKLIREALGILKAEHGTGPVNRGQAMCSVRITARDILVVEIPFFSGKATNTKHHTDP